VLEDVTVAAGAVLLPYSVCSASSVGEGARVGPFSHLRPDSVIGPEAHVGNFVETKKTRLARGAKANHLASLGDGEIGEGAYVATGTTVTKDVPPDALAIARVKQDNKEGYAPRLRAKLKGGA
jgi:bifunctional UDP-N-acetylglucosamine pyrophosphorylase/glucosamine-1-phosphate N-acetyltransferase